MSQLKYDLAEWIVSRFEYDPPYYLPGIFPKDVWESISREIQLDSIIEDMCESFHIHIDDVWNILDRKEIEDLIRRSHECKNQI